MKSTAVTWPQRAASLSVNRLSASQHENTLRSFEASPELILFLSINVVHSVLFYLLELQTVLNCLSDRQHLQNEQRSRCHTKKKKKFVHTLQEVVLTGFGCRAKKHWFWRLKRLDKPTCITNIKCTLYQLIHRIKREISIPPRKTVFFCFFLLWFLRWIRV